MSCQAVAISAEMIRLVLGSVDGMLPLTEPQIKDVVADPRTCVQCVLDWLKLAHHPIFAEADPRVLQGRIENLGAEERRALDAGLGDLAERLGYPAKIEQA